MQTKIKSLAALAGVLVPLATMGATAGPAAAATGVACTENTATVKLSPGLSATAKVQTITIKGSLSGCTDEAGMTHATYVAHEKTTEAVGCSALTGAGAPVEAQNLVVKWGAGNSKGSLLMPLTGAGATSLSGSIASGPFEGGAVAGSVSQTYPGAEKCGTVEGKKKAKPIKAGTLSGSFEISL